MENNKKIKCTSCGTYNEVADIDAKKINCTLCGRVLNISKKIAPLPKIYFGDDDDDFTMVTKNEEATAKFEKQDTTNRMASSSTKVVPDLSNKATNENSLSSNLAEETVSNDETCISIVASSEESSINDILRDEKYEDNNEFENQVIENSEEFENEYEDEDPSGEWEPIHYSPTSEIQNKNIKPAEQAITKEENVAEGSAPGDKETTASSITSARKRIVALKAKREQLRKEKKNENITYNFNSDGYYDDTQVVESVQGDSISKTTIIKSVASLLLVLGIIVFIIIYI